MIYITMVTTKIKKRASHLASPFYQDVAKANLS